MNENVERDREIHTIDRDVKDIGFKFDYFMFQMIKQGKMSVPALNMDEQEMTMYMEDGDETFVATETDENILSDKKAQEMLDQFKKEACGLDGNQLRLQ